MSIQELKVKEIETKLKATEYDTAQVRQSLEIIQDTIIQRDDDWRNSINKMIANAVIASGTNDFKALRQRAYEVLEERARCRLSVKLNNLKERLRENGATKTKIENTNRMDVIENDVRLKEIYTSIVKEFSIRFIPKEQLELV